ncbi:MAG: hypothetical protein ABI249_02465 [Ornithinibacter sp.]
MRGFGVGAGLGDGGVVGTGVGEVAGGGVVGIVVGGGAVAGVGFVRSVGLTGPADGVGGTRRDGVAVGDAVPRWGAEVAGAADRVPTPEGGTALVVGPLLGVDPAPPADGARPSHTPHPLSSRPASIAASSPPGPRTLLLWFIGAHLPSSPDSCDRAPAHARTAGHATRRAHS